MALFLDGPACTIDDLTDEDSGLLDTAQTAGINVSTKLELAMSELQSAIEAWLSRPQPVTRPAGVGTARISQVAVTPELARWEKMMTLSLIYRDAYFTQLVDRYQFRWDEYAKLSRSAREQFLAKGVGIVNDPLPKAVMPTLGSVPATTQQTGGTFYASVAWVNGTGQEGAPSDVSSADVEVGNLLTVAAVEAPRNAVGFNVYAGTQLDALQQQNQVPLSGGGVFIFIPGASTGGKLSGTGQRPDYVKPLVRTILRG